MMKRLYLHAMVLLTAYTCKAAPERRCDERILEGKEEIMTHKKSDRIFNCTKCDYPMEDTGRVEYSDFFKKNVRVYYCPDCKADRKVMVGGENLEIPEDQK